MHVHTCARTRAPPLAAAGAGAGPGSGSGLGLSLSSLPGLILFESGSKDPLLLRTCWIANGCAPVGLPKVAHLLDNQRLRNSPLRVNGCDCWAANRHVCWVERVQPFVWIQTCWPLLECYIKHSKLSFSTQSTTPTTTSLLSL